MLRYDGLNRYTVYHCPSGKPIKSDLELEQALREAAKLNRMVDESFDINEERRRVERQRHHIPEKP